MTSCGAAYLDGRLTSGAAAWRDRGDAAGLASSSPHERSSEPRVRPLHAYLGEGPYATACVGGRAMALDQAVEDALAADEVTA